MLTATDEAAPIAIHPRDSVRKDVRSVETVIPAHVESDDRSSRPEVESFTEQTINDEQPLRSDDAMAGLIVGGILTLAFTVLVILMVIVNLWTLSQ